MQWGPSIETLQRHYEQTGEMPPALRDKPEEHPEIEFIIGVFSMLSRFRPSGMNGPAAIPFQDVVTYASLVGYTGTDDTLFLARMISICDSLYLKRAADKAKAKKASKPSKAPSKPARGRKHGR